MSRKEDLYKEARAKVQAKAKETGYDYGLEWNSIFKEYSSFMLPMKKNRTGHELRCEVVMCDFIDRCKPGHGLKSNV